MFPTVILFTKGGYHSPNPIGALAGLLNSDRRMVKMEGVEAAGTLNEVGGQLDHRRRSKYSFPTYL